MVLQSGRRMKMEPESPVPLGPRRQRRLLPRLDQRSGLQLEEIRRGQGTPRRHGDPAVAWLERSSQLAFTEQ